MSIFPDGRKPSGAAVLAGPLAAFDNTIVIGPTFIGYVALNWNVVRSLVRSAGRGWGRVFAAVPAPSPPRRVARRLSVALLWVGLMASVITGCQSLRTFAAPVQAPSAPVVENADSAALRWVRENAVPLRAVEPGADSRDLEALRRIVGDSRIVMLGESTHGTREFYQLKHRMIEFLVKEMGFSVVAVETDFAKSNVVNAYVRHGRGDPAEAIAKLRRWPMDTEEILDFVRWMRRHNTGVDSSRQISYVGFDMQDGWGAILALREYLRRVDPEYAASALQPLDALMSMEGKFEEMKAYSRRPAEELARVSATVTEILQRVRSNRERYSAASSAEEWADAEHNALVLSQAEATWRDHRWPSTGDMRDRNMAENVLRLLERAGPEAKMIVWAHNAHVTKDLWFGREMMGRQIADKVGSDAVVIGFTTQTGTFQARGQQGSIVEHAVPSVPAGSLVKLFGQAGSPNFLVDLRRAPAGSPARTWLNAPRLDWSVGAQFSAQNEPVLINPAASYDVIAFLQRTTRARPITRTLPPATKVSAPRAIPVVEHVSSVQERR